MKENEKEKNVLNPISEQTLETIVGGHSNGHSLDNVTILHVKSDDFYKSGDTPKYSKGQHVWIEYRYQNQTNRVSCKIVDVTKTPELGLFRKEFGYIIELLENIPGYPKGTVRPEVYESRIYEN